MRVRGRIIVLLLAAAVFLTGLPAAKGTENTVFYYGGERRYAAGGQAVEIRADFYSTLSVASKAVYDSLVENVVSLRDGKYEIVFLFPESVQHEELSVTMYQDAMNAFNRDHSEVFWLDMATMKLTVTETEAGRLQGTITPVDGTYYTSAYTSAADVERDIALMETRIDEIATAAAEYDAIYERLLYIHDWLVLKNACNADGISSHMRAFEAVSALEGNLTGDSRPVCEGYARAFKLLCDELGIPCILITGEGISGEVQEPHMWNAVRLDGAWYAVDVTWDDPLYLEALGKPRYTYFLIGSDTLCDEGKLFSESHLEQNKLSTHASGVTYPMLSKAAYIPQGDVSDGEGSMARFTAAASYQEGLFLDVEHGAWYEEGVASAYALGLMKGTGDGKFGIAGCVTIAEALTMASRIHASYYGIQEEFQPLGDWYEVYAYLICRRTNGLWEFPGGKIEPGETPEQCLARECREELAIEVTVGSMLDRVRTCAEDGRMLELMFYETGICIFT